MMAVGHAHRHGAPPEVCVLCGGETPGREKLRVLALADQLGRDTDLDPAANGGDNGKGTAVGRSHHSRVFLWFGDLRSAGN